MAGSEPDTAPRWARAPSPLPASNNVNLSGVTIDNARIDGLTIFGMDVQALIQAELARRRGG